MAVVVRPVSEVMLTAAFGIPAPDGSCTSPRIEPTWFWVSCASTWTTLLPALRQSIHKEQELDDVAA